MTADAATVADALEPKTCPTCHGFGDVRNEPCTTCLGVRRVVRTLTYDQRQEAADFIRSHSAPPAEEVMEVVDILKGVSAFLHVHDAPDMLFNATEKAIALLGLSHALSRLEGEEMVEKLARVMWIDTTDKDYWDHLDEDTKNIYRGNAVAVLSTIQEEIKNG